MSQTINSGEVEANVTGSVTTTDSEYTIITAALTGTNNFGTVPAGKVWKIVYMCLSGYESANGYAHIKIDGAVVLANVCSGTSDSVAVSFPYSTALTATAGEIVSCTSVFDDVDAVIGYIEEDA